jgi:probable rRNA maturation factor
MEIDVRATAAGAPTSVRVRRLLSRAARAARAQGSGVSVLFCADARMRTLNRRWRGKDKSTDVLAFPTNGTGAGPGFLGDIVISVPYATREARRRREPAAREVDRLLVHGLLHLMGYDHETDDGEMDALEEKVRRRLSIADPPAVRAAAGERRAGSPARTKSGPGFRKNNAGAPAVPETRGRRH